MSSGWTSVLVCFRLCSGKSPSTGLCLCALNPPLGRGSRPAGLWPVFTCCQEVFHGCKVLAFISRQKIPWPLWTPPQPPTPPHPPAAVALPFILNKDQVSHFGEESSPVLLHSCCLPNEKEHPRMLLGREHSSATSAGMWLRSSRSCSCPCLETWVAAGGGETVAVH